LVLSRLGRRWIWRSDGSVSFDVLAMSWRCLGDVLSMSWQLAMMVVQGLWGWLYKPNLSMVAYTQRGQLVRENGPTLPNLPSYPNEVLGSTPRWLMDNRRNRSTNNTNPLVLAASLGVNVALLVGLVSVLVLGHLGLLSSGGSAAGPPSPVPVLPSPTTVSSPTPTSSWLQVSPSNVTLGCDNGQQTQFVVLQNTGTTPVQWKATLSLLNNQVVVDVGPNQGTLKSGTGVVLQIHNRTRDNGQQGGTQQGSIQFNPVNSSTPSVGSLPSLSYTAMVCSG
jgi:hypothetical protein